MNMIKNPEFVFDINKSHTVDTCLSVIAQVCVCVCVWCGVDVCALHVCACTCACTLWIMGFIVTTLAHKIIYV